MVGRLVSCWLLLVHDQIAPFFMVEMRNKAIFPSQRKVEFSNGWSKNHVLCKKTRESDGRQDQSRNFRFNNRETVFVGLHQC
jgi:hypothetical protein